MDGSDASDACHLLLFTFCFLLRTAAGVRMNAGEEKVEAPPLGGVFTEPWSPRKALGLLAVFGPAAVVASVSVGAGETIVVVREGAWAGYDRLWLVLLSVLAKGVFVTYMLGRYTAVSGEPLGQRLVRLPGPRGWLLLLIVALELFGAPFSWVPIAKPCGDLIHFLSQSALPDALPPNTWKNLFTSAFIALALACGIGLSYQKTERQQIAICAVLVAGTAIGTLMVRPDLGKALAGVFSFGRIPPAPAWAPPEASQHPWLMTATTFAYVGSSVMSYLAYASWVGLRGWGMTGHARIDELRLRARESDRLDYLPEDPEQVRRLRKSIEPLRWDVGMGALVLFFVTAAFMVSGAAVLYPLETRFEGWSLLTSQAHIWRAIHPGLVWVYYVCIAAAMWGTLQALPEVYGRVCQDFFQAIWPRRKWEMKRLQLGVCAYLFSVTMFLVWFEIPFDLLTQIAGFVLSNLAIFVALGAALYLNHQLPPALRTRPAMLAGAVAALVVLGTAAALSGRGLLLKLFGV
jgi:Mn2+/Fe2+ NRAMP family transporter